MASIDPNKNVTNTPEWLRKLQVDFEEELMADTENSHAFAQDGSVVSDVSLFQMLGGSYNTIVKIKTI